MRQKSRNKSLKLDAIRRYFGSRNLRRMGGPSSLSIIGVVLAFLQLHPLAVPRAETGDVGCVGVESAWICWGGRGKQPVCPAPVPVQLQCQCCEHEEEKAGNHSRPEREELDVKFSNKWQLFLVLSGGFGELLLGLLIGCCHGRLNPRNKDRDSGTRRPDIVARAHSRAMVGGGSVSSH